MPTVYEKEMFLRFFEELEQMVREDYISEKEVYSYFSYYFMILWNDKDNFWDSQMVKPYKEMIQAQQAPEWNNVKRLYDRLSKLQR